MDIFGSMVKPFSSPQDGHDGFRPGRMNEGMELVDAINEIREFGFEQLAVHQVVASLTESRTCSWETGEKEDRMQMQSTIDLGLHSPDTIGISYSICLNDSKKTTTFPLYSALSDKPEVVFKESIADTLDAFCTYSWIQTTNFDPLSSSRHVTRRLHLLDFGHCHFLCNDANVDCSGIRRSNCHKHSSRIHRCVHGH